MKREEKNALSKRRIIDAALREFSAKGYDAASLNTVCGENDISKGIIYHYFKDKDEVYIACAGECFYKLTQHLSEAMENKEGSAEERLKRYFDARQGFFEREPVYLGIFLSAAFNAPKHLAEEIAKARLNFDRLNTNILTELLKSAPLRKGLDVPLVVEDFRMYMDYFNLRLSNGLLASGLCERTLKEHEERRRRQIGILLYGVLEGKDEKRDS